MLCPVCKLTPLTGRKATAKTCSAKCRSALYRDRKQKRDDTSQQAVTQRAETRAAESAEHRRPTLRDPDGRNLEQLVSTATARIVEAIQKHGLSSASSSLPTRRVDMRDQVTSQAPKLAVGYRLVLPARRPSDVPKLSPTRSRARAVAWYSLMPFEYSDDLRLCDGCWYRIVWIDAQGQRIRLQPGEPVPGLYYFVGPPQPSSHPAPHAPQPQDPETVQATPASPKAVNEPAITAGATQPNEAVVAQPAMSVAVPSGGLDDDIMAKLVDELCHAQQRDKAQAARQAQASDLADGSASLVFMLPPHPATAPPENWTRLLASFPPISVDESILLVDFVVHPEVMLQVKYEEQLAEASASRRPPPREPVTMVSHEYRQHLHALFTGQLVRPHFWARLLAIFEFVRKHGVEVLAHLPVPVPALPEAGRHWIEKAITSAPKRTYMHYVCARQDAMIDGLPLPVEPNVPLSSKERNQIRRTLEDLRAVMLFKQRTASTQL